MPNINEQILAEIRELNSGHKELKHYLYGEDGFEGDIPEIKRLCAGLAKADKDQLKKIHRIELILAASGILGGGTLGIIKLLS